MLLALFMVGLGLTQAYAVLAQINPVLFLLACLFFIFSVFLWVISWSYLIKKHSTISPPPSYKSLLKIGFSSLYGAVTPVQLGADALRSFRLKQIFGMRYSESVSASMAVKGAKFLILAFVTSVIMLIFLSRGLEPVFAFAFLSGFAVVLLACFLFLAPMHRGLGTRISSFFGALPHRVPLATRLSKFFNEYSAYLRKTSARSFTIIIFLSAFSWLFEFLALQFSFLALGISLSLHSLLILMVLVSVLERTPFLPRGIGLVEFAGYQFLAFPGLVAGALLTVPQIVAVIIAYDIARLAVPTLFSIGLNFALPNPVKN